MQLQLIEFKFCFNLFLCLFLLCPPSHARTHGFTVSLHVLVGLKAPSFIHSGERERPKCTGTDGVSNGNIRHALRTRTEVEAATGGRGRCWERGRGRARTGAGANGRGRAEAATKQEQKQRQTKAATVSTTGTEALEDRSGGRGRRPGMGCRQGGNVCSTQRGHPWTFGRPVDKARNFNFILMQVLSVMMMNKAGAKPSLLCVLLQC